MIVDGEEGYRTAKAFMKMLMPSHAKRIKPYRDPSVGLLQHAELIRGGELPALRDRTHFRIWGRAYRDRSGR